MKQITEENVSFKNHLIAHLEITKTWILKIPPNQKLIRGYSLKNNKRITKQNYLKNIVKT